MHCTASNYRVSCDDLAKNHDNQLAIDSDFMAKFPDKTVKINAVKNSTKFQFSNGNENTVEEYDFDEVLNIIEKYGSMITKLKLDYDSVHGYYRSLLNQQINNFCSKTLIDIELIHCSESDILQFPKPFEKVETVEMSFGHLMNPLRNPQQPTTSFSFNVIFPSVRRMNLGEMYFVHSNFLEHHFEQLEHLVMESFPNHHQDLSPVEKRLLLNPQLKHISLFHCNWKLLKTISEDMTNLKSLELNAFNDFSNYTGDIIFNRLKIFRFQKFSAMSKTIPRIPLVFGNIYEISCSKPMDKWLDIIFQNKQLKKVTTGTISNEILFKIVDELPELEDFTTGYNVYDSTKSVIQFIHMGSHLKRASFWQSNFNSPDEIKQQLSNKWTFFEDGGRFVFSKI